MKTYDTATVRVMTVIQAKKLGVQQFRDGKTFAAYDVRPAGFFMACLAAKRLDLVDALDHGWHVANCAEPVKFDDGTVMQAPFATAELEHICEA